MLNNHSTLNTAYLNGCLDQWREGDLQGRDSLIRCAVSRLEPLARRMLKGFPNVQRFEQTGDVLQNAMLRLMRCLETIRPASTQEFFGLAAVQIRRELFDLARHHRNHARPTGKLDDCTSVADPFVRIADRGDSTEELERWCAFHHNVEKLAVEEREVVGLIFYHGWTQAQVAELFGISDRTVRRRWEDAMKKLHAILTLDE